MMIEKVRPDELKEGQTALIKHWVNQPQYVGDTLRMENGKLIRTTKDGIDTISVDMRYLHYCEIEIENYENKEI